MNPTNWFDQFPGLDEQGVRWPDDSQWCARHWAPAALLHANGIGANIELLQHWVEQVNIPSNQTDLLNMQMALDIPLCCKFGDQYMYDLWGRWPPAKEKE